MKDVPELISGGLAVDDRGTLRFVNPFEFEGVKRFYQVENHERGLVRAWHGHRRAGLYVYVPRGAAIIAAIRLDLITNPSSDEAARLVKDNPSLFVRHVLSDTVPTILWIPPGFANGARPLTDDTIIQYFSTATLAESKQDDIRFDARRMDYVWDVVPR